MRLGQVRFYVGVGRGRNYPSQTSIFPRCDIKHCSTNSKHRHIGANSSIMWPSRYGKMRFRPGTLTWLLWGSSRRFRRPLSIGEGTFLPIFYTLAIRRLDLGDIFPEYFLSGTPEPGLRFTLVFLIISWRCRFGRTLTDLWRSLSRRWPPGLIHTTRTRKTRQVATSVLLLVTVLYGITFKSRWAEIIILAYK